MSQIIIDNYGSQDAPDLAKFGVGGNTVEQIQRATEARRELSDHQSTTRGPIAQDK